MPAEGGRGWGQGCGPPSTSQSLPLCRCCSGSEWKFEVPPFIAFSRDRQVFSQLSSALGTHGWWGQKQGIGLGLGS